MFDKDKCVVFRGFWSKAWFINSCRYYHTLKLSDCYELFIIFITIFALRIWFLNKLK